MTELTVGQRAPALQVLEFVVGEPVSELRTGIAHVISLWSTWCGACQQSLHLLSDLQESYPEALILSVAIFEACAEDVKPYIQFLDRKPRHRIAVDYPLPARLTDKQGRPKGWMAQHWFEAAYQNGLPTSFIVDTQGIIAWIGSPFDIKDPLSRILAGTWDLETYIRSREETIRALRLEERQILRSKIEKAPPEQVLDLTDEAFANRPEFTKNSEFILQRIAAYLSLGRKAEALECVQSVERSSIADDPGLVLLTATELVRASELDKTLADGVLPILFQAYEALTRITTLGPVDVMRVEMYVARVLTAKGERGDAWKHVEQARKLVHSVPEKLRANATAELEHALASLYQRPLGKSAQ